MRKNIASLAMLIMLLTLTAMSVYAAYINVPTPPNEDFTVISSTRRQYVGSKTIQAEAGNVSEIRINASVVTRGWQGYYGNITGVIVLDDAQNNSMYTWELADPEGEVFASDSSTMTWTDGNIVCANITVIEAEETAYGFNGGTGQDVDGINETFAQTSHPAFSVANNTFAADECTFNVATFVDDGADSNMAFNETMLYSNAEGDVVWMAHIYQGGSDGFKSGDTNYDFQMIVVEDGHDGDTSVTDYYFWVELE